MSSRALVIYPWPYSSQRVRLLPLLPLGPLPTFFLVADLLGFRPPFRQMHLNRSKKRPPNRVARIANSIAFGERPHAKNVEVLHCVFARITDLGLGFYKSMRMHV
jgi:hypothetical protein